MPRHPESDRFPLVPPQLATRIWRDGTTSAIPAAGGSNRPSPLRGHGPQPGYSGGTALGSSVNRNTVAAIYGLLAGAYFGLTDNPYLRWSLLAAVPVAVIAVATALLATRLPGDVLAGWMPQTRQPVIPVVLAAAGVLTMWASLSVSPSVLPLGSALGRLGAAATGIAIALTVTRAPLLRLIVGAYWPSGRPRSSRLPTTPSSKSRTSWPSPGGG